MKRFAVNDGLPFPAAPAIRCRFMLSDITDIFIHYAKGVALSCIF
jgi:hypothetical protein